MASPETELTTQDMVPATPQTSAALGLPSDWSSSTGELPLLDLSFLTEEEREKIESVLQADEQLKTRDRIRLGTLRQDIQQARTHQKGVSSNVPRVCTCCERQFGRIFNTGAPCPQCGYRVCKQCRKVPYTRPPKYVCDVCAKQKLLDLQVSGNTPNTSKTVTPLSSRSNSPVPTRPATNQNGDEAALPLYGSELVKKSLKAVGQRSRSTSPVPILSSGVRPSLMSSSSVTSSIVVRYEQRSSSESSPSPSTKRVPLSSVARRVSAKELLESDEEEEEKPAKQEKQPKPAVPAAVDHLKRSDSMGSLGSMTSMYSAAGGKGDYAITGEVFTAVWYNDGQLFVKVVKARGLAAAKKGTSDPYIKTYLLPDRSKHTKRKTAIQRKTLNPVFNEILKNKVDRADLRNHTLWLSVWDWDRFGRNQFLGEVRLPLSTLDLTDSTERWHTLMDKEDGVNDDDFYRGKLRLSIKVQPSTDQRGNVRKGMASLHIRVHQAQELPKMNPMGLTDATVKCYLLPNRHSGGKRKTKVVKNNLNPVWEEEFKYDFLTINELSNERVLEVTVWDFDRRGSNDFIGGLRLGSAPGRAAKHKEWMDSIGEEVTHWESVLSRPGEWVEMWHTLRPTMHPLTKHGSPSGMRKISGLSPVKELSPTRELEIEESGPAVVAGVALSPPITPEVTPLHKPTAKTHTPSPSHEPMAKTHTPSPSHTPTITASHESLTVSRETTPIPEVVVTASDTPPLKREEYYGSQASVYSAAGGKGDYDISGEVLFGVHYKAGQLLVTVNQARGLAAADSNGFSDPYVKTYLLPDKSKTSKKKTAIKKKTLNPVYNETLKYNVNSADLETHTLWLSVWDWDRFGRNQFLGEVRLPLSTLDLTDSTERWHTLLDKDESSSLGPSPTHTAQNVVTATLNESPLTQRTEPPSQILESATPLNEDPHTRHSPSPPRIKPDPFPLISSTSLVPKLSPAVESPDPSSVHVAEAETSAAVVSEPTPLINIGDLVSSGEHLEHEEKHHKGGGLLGLKSFESLSSFGSQASVYSAAGGKGDYDISGEVLFGVHYKAGQLLVTVNQARGLAAAGSNGFSDPYVKTYLLPDKSKTSKKKTAIKKKTLNPVYNETLKYNVNSADLETHTLWLSVWDWDRFGRNQFLGEARLPLSTLDLTDPTEHWHTLLDKAEHTGPSHSGELWLGVKYESHSTKGKGTLHVCVKQARDLPLKDNQPPNAQVKSLLLPTSRVGHSKKKTRSIGMNASPIWEESFSYEGVSREELSHERVLEVSVWNRNSKSDKDFLGGLRLGPAPGHSAKHKEWMDSIGEEVTHWETVLSRPGEWVEIWHTLRTTMDYRHIDLSATHIHSHSSSPHHDDVPPVVPPTLTSTPDTHITQTQVASSLSQHARQDPPTQTSVSVDPPTPILASAEPPTQISASVDPPEQPSVNESTIAPVAHSTPVINIGDLRGSKEHIEEEEEPHPKPKALSSLQRGGGLLGLKSSDSVYSFGSQTSVYSAAGGKGDYDISGEVLFGVHYKAGQLLVTVNQARGLAAADSNGFSDPYVKTYLLPDKSKTSKKKTAIKKKTLNPVYNETLKYKVNSADLETHTLWLSVWDWDRFGRNQFLGEVRLPLSTLDITDSTERWHTLLDKDEGGEGASYHGQLQLSLMFSPSEKHGKSKKTKGTLNIAIRQAKDLPLMQSSGSTDAFVKCYLLPDKGGSGKRKTGVVKNNLNPVWGTTFSYEKVSLEELSSERALEVVVWDFNKGGSSDFIGGLRLGPAPGRAVKHKEWMDSIGEEVTHWESVLSQPGEWVEIWHTLRTTMDYRSVALS